ncbi:MAG: hypothetical protein ACLQVG_32755 [Terriglobia bacterium]
MPITINDLKTVDTYKRALMRDVPHISSGTAFQVYCGGKIRIENVKLPGLGINQELPFLLLFGEEEMKTVTDWLRSKNTEVNCCCEGTCSMRENKLILDLYPNHGIRSEQLKRMCEKISKLLVNISVETVSEWFVTDKTGRSWGIRTMKEVVLEQTGRPLRPINPPRTLVGEMDNKAERKVWGELAIAKLDDFFEEKYPARSHPDTWMCYDIVNDFLRLLDEIKPRDQLAVENIKTLNGTVPAYNSVYHKITLVTVKALEAKQQAVSRMADERIRKGEYARVRETFEKLAGDLKDTTRRHLLE